MRPEGTPLDLNNLPEDYGGDRYREGKQVSEESSTTATDEAPDARCRKKKNGKDGKECGKIYECRFCSLKFCKSQALGGHMNRHRQERETETLNRARQLVFSNENLGGQGHFLGCNVPLMSAGNFSQRGPMGDPSLSFQPVYTRLPSPSSTSILPQQPLQPYLYPSSSRFLSFPSPYPPPPTNDYFVGHVLSPHRPMNPSYSNESNYTCIGAPIVTHSFPSDGLQAPNAADSVRFNQANGLNWNCGDGDRPDADGSPMDRFRNDY